MIVALAQINPIVGDLEGNASKIIQYAKSAAEQGADIVVFPEMALTGYPPEDLLYREDFIRAAHAHRDRINNTAPITVVYGSPVEDGAALYNAAVVQSPSRPETHLYKKHRLPNYGVFDERRYFIAGDHQLVIGDTFATTVCEDIWHPDAELYTALREGATGILNLSASPYHIGKQDERETMLKTRARDTCSWVFYCNLVGGQDELVFDGQSVVIDHTGRVVSRAKAFSEDLILVSFDPTLVEHARRKDIRYQEYVANLDFDTEIYEAPLDLNYSDKKHTRVMHEPLAPMEEIRRALVLGTRDYVRKNGLSKVVVGVSGGIDSAVVLNIAVEALGAENVVGITMPSKFSSDGTLSDAENIMTRLSVEAHTIPIQGIVDAYTPLLTGDKGVTMENLQARIRGNILMAHSNSTGALVLSCGNKSEMSVGYATLYGDMSGGYNPIKDLYKLNVYKLARHIDRCGGDIPLSIIEREPSAELSEDQKDSDSLPPYELLDTYLASYIEEDRSMRTVTEDASRVCDLVDFNEFKRRQAPPGIKLTKKAFGRDRRMPIVNRWRG